MFVSSIKNHYIKVDKERFFQGDILRDVNVLIDSPSSDSQAEGEMDSHHLPYCIIMTQDCDLKWDFEKRKNGSNNDKHLPTILVCPAYSDEAFFTGKHIDGWQMQEYKGKAIDKLKGNDEINRCHYLKGDSDFQVPNLVIDFKHFYTLPTATLYKQYSNLYLATINELFRERLSQRFANYLSRFGLPDLNEEIVECEIDE